MYWCQFLQVRVMQPRIGQTRPAAPLLQQKKPLKETPQKQKKDKTPEENPENPLKNKGKQNNTKDK